MKVINNVIKMDGAAKILDKNEKFLKKIVQK
jgi:hypothetical protein